MKIDSIFLFFKTLNCGKEKHTMKVFKKIIAGVVAGTLVLAMATSAFAATATVSNEGVVTPSGFTAATSGNMVVMVVSAEAYDAGSVAADDICYVDIFAASEAATKLNAAVKAINLKHGTYYVVVGGPAAAQKSEVIGTITVGDVAVDGKTLTWVVSTKAAFQSGLTAKLYNTSTGDESTAVDLTWDEGIVTGEGDVEFEVVTVLRSAQYADSTELEIASGAVSDRN